MLQSAIINRPKGVITVFSENNADAITIDLDNRSVWLNGYPILTPNFVRGSWRFPAQRYKKHQQD